MYTLPKAMRKERSVMAKFVIPWKKAGIIFSIIASCLVVVAGYCDTKFTAKDNTKDIVKLDLKTDKGFDKIEKKMDEFSREQVILKVQTSAILEAVSFLKMKAEE